MLLRNCPPAPACCQADIARGPSTTLWPPSRPYYLLEVLPPERDKRRRRGMRSRVRRGRRC